MVSLTDIHITRDHDAGAPDEDLSYLSMESVFTAPEIGRDERRMQVRAYNHWLAHISDGELPAIEELRPEALDDLGPSGVLVDLTLGLSRPAIIHLGDKLAAECGDDRDIFGIGDVPERSLLSRITEHCLEVVANRSPVGFDAEFIDRRGQSIMYRSILLPYSSDGQTADFVFGVISWKHGTDEAPAAEPAPAAPVAAAILPIIAETPRPEQGLAAPDLAQLLAQARDLAQTAVNSEQRSHRALYAAIARLHAFALAALRDANGLEALLTEAGLVWQPRAPLTALVRLGFGSTFAKSRLSEVALVLTHAQRLGLDPDQLEDTLIAAPGGLKGVLIAERGLRRAERPAAPAECRGTIARKLRRLVPQSFELSGEFGLLLARRNPDGTIALLGDPGEVRLLEQAAKRLLAA